MQPDRNVIAKDLNKKWLIRVPLVRWFVIYSGISQNRLIRILYHQCWRYITPSNAIAAAIFVHHICEEPSYVLVAEKIFSLGVFSAASHSDRSSLQIFLRHATFTDISQFECCYSAAFIRGFGPALTAIRKNEGTVGLRRVFAPRVGALATTPSGMDRKQKLEVISCSFPR